MPKRFISLLSVFIFIFTSLAGRCAYIALSNTYQVADTYNSYTLKIGTLYTNFYDRTGIKLNNNKTYYAAVIRPNEKCLSELDKLFTADEIKEITEELSDGYPIVKYIAKFADTKYIKLFKCYDNSVSACRHLLDKSCGGIENYASEEIGSLSVNFSVDALGRLLSGDEGTVVNDNYDSNDGIVLSIDSKLQSIAEDAAKSIPKGAVVILDTQTSEILACVSRGDDYVNRALSPYAIGSVFKLVVAVCALENNIDPLYTCTSKIKVADMTVHCQKNKRHSMQTIKTALANSCNCYFVNLALKLGSDKINETAKKLGFGSSFNIYRNWNVNSGTFPDENTLSSRGQLALIGFGQGKLTDSPLHFASVISCIANGGSYNSPTLDILNTSIEDKDKEKDKNQVISENTTEKIKEYMHYVVTNGTGSTADYHNKTAGKTATAQSGIYNNQTEILNTWFAGFYPYNSPKYSIVVMRENGTSGAGDCCPVFRSIVEKIDKM